MLLLSFYEINCTCAGLVEKRAEASAHNSGICGGKPQHRAETNKGRSERETRKLSNANNFEN